MTVDSVTVDRKIALPRMEQLDRLCLVAFTILRKGVKNGAILLNNAIMPIICAFVKLSLLVNVVQTK